ncbi:uncharacterized protein M6G45_015406 [Spheniscus humboldti]
MPFPTMAPCNVSPLLCSGSHGQIPQKPFRSTLRSRSCSGTSSSASGRDGKASKSQQLWGRRCRQTRQSVAAAGDGGCAAGGAAGFKEA